MKKLLLPAVLALLSLISFIHYDNARFDVLQKSVQFKVGTTNTKFVGTLPTYLAGAGISTSATSISVTSLTLPQTTQPLQMSDFGSTGYATLEPGNSSRQEFISFTGITQNTNGTAILTGVTRGLSPVYPYTASSTMQFTHGGGTTVIISNSPPFLNNLSVKNNDEAITGLWTFNSVLPTSSLLATTSNQFVTKTYVDSGLLAGAATGTESVTGIVRLATALQAASSTPSTSNTPLVMQAQNATDTPTRGCATGYTSTAGAGCSPIALLTGKLKQAWLNLSEAWTFTATTTFSATTTFNGVNENLNQYFYARASTTIAASPSNPIPVFLATSTNALWISSANTNGTSSDFLGFAVSNATNGATTTVQISGIANGFTGLTAGMPYYVQNTTGTIGTSMGTNELYVGRAISATQILMDRREEAWQYLGSATCSFSTGTAVSCDTASIPYARFATANIVSGTANVCSGPTANTAAQVQLLVSKVGQTTASTVVSPACATTRNPSGAFTFTATFTSTSSVRMQLSSTDSLTGTPTETAYFYR